jgi:benzylsuccinate CoA-transferase BbsE subunit
VTQAIPAGSPTETDKQMINAADPRPYDAIRIIDLTHELGSYCTRLFADLGAEVIRVEPPTGGVDRRRPPTMGEVGDAGLGGIPFAFLNLNKKSVTLDAASGPGRAVLRDLIAASQVVVWEPGSGLDVAFADILAIPGARVATAVSHFGLTGPYAHFVGCDLVDQALGGLAWLSGEAGQPPLRLAGEQSLFVASLYAAAATALALWDCESRGVGHVIDVSAQEAIAHSLQNAPQAWDLEGHISVRGGEGIRDATENAYRCRDGYVFLAAPLALSASWSGLLAWMRDEGFAGLAELQTSAWADRPTRATAPMKERFRILFERFVAGRTKAELAAEALRRKVVLAPVSRIADLPQDPQLLFRRFFQKLPMPGLGHEIAVPGAPYRLSEPLWRLDRAAPRRGADNDTVPGAMSPPARRAGA